MRDVSGRSKAQIAFEFLVVYSFVLVIFVVVFLLITSERASELNSQGYSSLQLLAQDAAGYIDQAVFAGPGYNASIPLPGSLGSLPYNITVSTTGVVIVSTKTGSQTLSALAFSDARNLVVNGTLSTQSVNSIQLFVLKNTGILKIANKNGIIFVDTAPPPTGNLATYLSARVVGKSIAGSFNGAGSRGTIPKIAISNSLSVVTLSAWVYPVQSTSRIEVIDFANSQLNLQSGKACFQTSGLSAAVCSASSVPPNTWSFIAGSYSGTSEFVYLNGVSNSLTPSGSVSINTNGAIGYCSYCGGGDNFNGLIADIQAYNTSLTQAQVQAIYSQGFGGAPIMTQNAIGWWPLNGNMNDYSGNNDDAFPANVLYQTVVQVNAYPLALNGTTVSFPALGNGVPVFQLTGFASGSGALGYNGMFNDSFAHNIAAGFLTSNGAKGRVNFTVSEFNGNNTVNFTSTTGLVAWLPLDNGYGNSVYSFGSYPLRLSTTSSPGGFPGWSIVNRNITNFQAASFPGNINGQNGLIAINSISQYNATTVSNPFGSYIIGSSNNSFTAVAWIYFRGNTPAHYQGIFGNLGSNTSAGYAGFQMVGSGSGAGALDINRMIVPWPSGNPGNYPTNVWLMVAAQYSPNSGVASVYLNGSLYASNNIGTGLSIINSQLSPFYIGDDAWQPGGLDTFNGLISNVQLYASMLNQSQINSMYMQGPTGAPMFGSNLVGWWSLAGNTSDATPANNKGFIQSNVIFKNVQYGNYTLPSARYSASFNPVSANAYSASASLGVSNTATVVAWINPKPKQGAAIYNMFFDYGSFSGAGGSLGVGVQSTGLPVLSAWSDDFTPTNGVGVNFNGWNFIAARLSGQSANVFINGVWNNGTLPSLPNVQSGTIVVGGQKSSTGIFNGSVTDLQVYNIALTPLQIQQIYEQGFPPSVRMNLSVS
jgi:hypothetical protein